MNTKKRGQSSGLGDFMVPLIECLSEILLFSVKMLSKGFYLFLTRYVFKDSNEFKELSKIERKQIQSKKRTLDNDAIGFSVTQNRILKTSEINKEKHNLIVGASGFGKTCLLDSLIFDDLCKNKPVFFIDPKGSKKSIDQFINLCRLKKRKFAIFSEHYEGACKLYLNPAKIGSVTSISDRIHYSFDWSEEHYAVLCYSALKKAVRDLIDNNVTTSYKTILDKILELSDPKNKTREFDREKISGIIMRLENIIDSEFGSIIDSSGKSFKELWDENKCIYIGLPVLRYPRIARSLGRCIVNDLAFTVSTIHQHYNLESLDNLTALGVYIDELSSFITDEFIEILNKCRDVKMELNIAFQSPSDIIKVSEELNDQIFENSCNWFVMKQRVSKNASFLSDSIGTIESKKKTIRVEGDEEKEQGSQRVVEELIAHSNIIKNLNSGQTILLRHNPSQVDLINLKYIDPRVVEKNILIAENRGEIKKLESVKNNTQKKVKEESSQIKEALGGVK